MVEVKFCGKCGSSISSQNIIEGKAKFQNGQLVCNECMANPPQQPQASGAAKDEPIALEMDDEPISLGAPSAPQAQGGEIQESEQIHVFAGDTSSNKQAQTFTRKPNNTGTGAIRVRTFDTKLSRGAMEMMDDQINAWLDENGYEVKFVSTTIGDVQGKKTEPHLIVNIWY